MKYLKRKMNILEEKKAKNKEQKVSERPEIDSLLKLFVFFVSFD